MSDRPTSFYFGPRSKRGLIAGIQTGQLLIVAIALLVTVMILRNVQSASRGVLCVATICIATAIAFLPIGGRTTQEWIPVVSRYLFDVLSGKQMSVISPEPGRKSVDRPGVFYPISLLQLPEHLFDTPFGVVHDAQIGTWTAVLALDGGTFALASQEEQTRRASTWAMVLASAAKDASRLYRLQWIERTIPESAVELSNHFRQRHLSEIETQNALRRARQSYAQLLERDAAGTSRHEVLLGVSVLAAKRNRGRLSRSVFVQEQASLQALATEVSVIARRCGEAGIKVRGKLSCDELKAYVQRGFATRPTAAPASWPWPTALSTNWSAVCTDGTWHATYWIAEWPRTEVSAGFLTPLLIGAHERRSVSVVMSPVPPLKAVRTAERDKTADVADAELRRRHGFTATARTTREREAVVRREAELAEGHAAYRFSGYITVSATDRIELEQSCARIEQAGAAARLELRRLYGSQAEALCNTLPIGRGCG